MIVVTGATGKLGHHVINALLQHLPGDQIVAAVRRPEQAETLKSLGVRLRRADYSQPKTLATAFEGAEKVLLISSNELGQRVPQHSAVVDAAKTAGVSLLAYTSILRASTSSLALAVDHKETEEYIRSSGVPFVFLRNGWYLENHTESLGPAIDHGSILGAAGEGRFAAAARADYALAAALVLTGAGHTNKTYELAGDTSYTLSELAVEVSKAAGEPVAYRNLPEEQFAKALLGFGLPALLAEVLANSDVGAARGELDSHDRCLSDLIGRPTASMAQAVANAVAA